MRIFVVAMGIAPLMLAPYTTALGANPTREQLIQMLTPPADVSSGPVRGSRPVLAPPISAEPAKAPVRVAARAMPAPDDALPSTEIRLNFESGSATLSRYAMKDLDELGLALNSSNLLHYRFRIEGHTDTVGTPEGNRILSEKRAKAVVEYLESKFGVAPDRLEYVGMGQDQLLVPTGLQVAELRNRRVQIVNIGN